jgi:DNA-binding HxlR family transcriptional regulator
MAAFDLLGRRWILRVLWELRSDAHSFRSLQTACGDISPAVLNTRLRELRDAGLVGRGDEGYGVTELGRQLIEALAPIDAWSKRWDRVLGQRAREAGRRS